MVNQKLRVLFVSHTYVLGINQGKLNALAATGEASVGLLVPNQWNAKGWKSLYTLEQKYHNITYYPSRVYGGSRGGGYWYSPTAVRDAIEDFRPNILQVEQEVFSLSAFQMARCSRKTGIPLIIFVWENLDRHLLLPRQWMADFVLKTAKLIIAGNQDGKFILQKWGYQQPIEVMPQMGVDPTIFSTKLHQDNHQNKFRIGYMGRLIYHKGIDVLLKAIRQIKDNGCHFQLILYGSGQYKERLRQEAQKQQVDDLIEWKGKVPHADVPKVMGQFDALVLPSRATNVWKEQFGHVLIEAMSMGIPVVGSSCGEIPHVIGRSDLIFSENDAKALATILERLIRHPSWCQEVRQYGLSRVHQHYTHARIAERLIDIWQQILKSSYLE